MKFFQKITSTQIFNKVVQIANNQIKDVIRNKVQQKKVEDQFKVQRKADDNIQGQKYIRQQTLFYPMQPKYQQAQRFVLQLNANSKRIKKQQMEKKKKKHIFDQLQIQPIYLQSCNLTNLFKMQIELGQGNKGYERTEVLHQFLNQINQTIKKVLFSQESIQILQTFQMVDTYLHKTNALLAKIKILKQIIHKVKVQREIKIKQTMKKKLIIKQKIALLHKMKQKQQMYLVKPQNLQQIYYSQRNRHKMYIKLKNMTNLKFGSYFQNLKNQIIGISQNNVKILQKTFRKWINQSIPLYRISSQISNKKQSSVQQISRQDQITCQKNTQKLLICLYFVKTQLIYKDNGIDISFKNINKEKLIQQIEKVKNWKNYQYIRDPAMKSKILEFLNAIIQNIH